MAFGVLQHAMNTSDIDGLVGTDDFPPVEPATAGAASSSGQGGLHDDHDARPAD